MMINAALSKTKFTLRNNIVMYLLYILEFKVFSFWYKLRAQAEERVAPCNTRVIIKGKKSNSFE